ncbi:phospho-sugar mutase [Fundicoccus sp. Sow4_H7]|uniref:phospho-sugar mutase n=1 Tax=Fundicoccus sp. Sow4_H7 TaxID=3438784 RepID=UPI003F8DD512
MSWKEKMQSWMKSDSVEKFLKEELQELNENQQYEAFYRYLEFGTGGMRGVIGVGTNRINSVMIRRVSYALAQHIINFNGQASGVVISYDNRHFSKEFADIAASVLTANGINVYLSDFNRPTPIVSLMVRELKAAAGIMITASHNPSQYNGFKVYGSDGCQITLDYAEELNKLLDKIQNEELLTFEMNPRYLNMLSTEVDDIYLEKLKQVTVDKDLIRKKGSEIKILYTPLHGTGQKLVEKGLKELGFSNSQLVESQADYDSDFSTVAYPNPEEQASFEKAINYTQQFDAHIILATDPDADRVGVAVKVNNKYELLNGNQIGILILDYLSQQKKNISGQHVIKTIVSSDLANKIAEKNQLILNETLTGFKFIGEKIAEIEARNETFLFGFEESFGYLIQPYVRDKDAIQASIIISEMALFYLQNGMTLFDRLEEIYQEFGYYKEQLITQSFVGSKGMNEMSLMIDELRSNYPLKIGSQNVHKIEDYLKGEAYDVARKKTSQLSLPKSNVLKFFLEDGSWIVIRPSGTEPKCKIYLSVFDQEKAEVINKADSLQQEFLGILEKIKNNF